MKTNQKAIENKNDTATKTSTNKTINADTKAANADVKSPVDAAKAKEEARKILEKEKPLFNLESTLEVLENLYARTRQRNRLVDTIKNLESFEIDIKKDEDELGGNHFQGCTLKISDDNRNEFSTRNPVVIAAVANFVREMCTDRLAEIEATIVLP